jgi:DeoR/GlpR family transcriptional regulator of sugar metabolism
MKMNHKDKVEWRRDQIQQLLAKGHNSHREISGILQIPKTTVTRDIQFLNQEAKNSVRKYIDERLPEEYERILVGVTSILREAWEISRKEEIDTKEKIQALSLAKECYSMKLDLLTNASVIDDAARFVSEHNNKKEEKNISSVVAVAKEEEKEEETTTNQVF